MSRLRPVPARLVSSSKSWLCHSGLDRTAAILPWGMYGHVWDPVRMDLLVALWAERLAFPVEARCPRTSAATY